MCDKQQMGPLNFNNNDHCRRYERDDLNHISLTPTCRWPGMACYAQCVSENIHTFCCGFILYNYPYFSGLLHYFGGNHIILNWPKIFSVDSPNQWKNKVSIKFILLVVRSETRDRQIKLYFGSLNVKIPLNQLTTALSLWWESLCL